jgi:hypothetical protein
MQIMAHLIGTRTMDLLKMITSNGKFNSLKYVEVLIDDMNAMQKPTSSIAEKEEKLDALMAVATTSDLSFFSTELLKSIDSDAKDLFKKCIHTIGVKDDTYTTQLNLYIQAVLCRIDQHCADKPLLEKAKARFRWLMLPRKNKLLPLPIMTESVIKYMCMSFANIKNAVEEVCHHCNTSTALMYSSAIAVQPLV